MKNQKNNHTAKAQVRAKVVSAIRTKIDEGVKVDKSAFANSTAFKNVIPGANRAEFEHLDEIIKLILNGNSDDVICDIVNKVDAASGSIPELAEEAVAESSTANDVEDPVEASVEDVSEVIDVTPDQLVTVDATDAKLVETPVLLSEVKKDVARSKTTPAQTSEEPATETVQEPDMTEVTEPPVATESTTDPAPNTTDATSAESAEIIPVGPANGPTFEPIDASVTTYVTMPVGDVTVSEHGEVLSEFVDKVIADNPAVQSIIDRVGETAQDTQTDDEYAPIHKCHAKAFGYKAEKSIKLAHGYTIDENRELIGYRKHKFMNLYIPVYKDEEGEWGYAIVERVTTSA